jgi:DNA segregation ATPase FtsK/SpoIIIE-like protein
MTDIKTLEQKINELEKRLQKLENEKDWTDAIYDKAKELVLKHHKYSAIFLQRKLLIDYERATKILEKLRLDGVIA